MLVCLIWTSGVLSRWVILGRSLIILSLWFALTTIIYCVLPDSNAALIQTPLFQGRCIEISVPSNLGNNIVRNFECSLCFKFRRCESNFLFTFNAERMQSTKRCPNRI